MSDTSKFTVTQEMTDAFYSKAEVTSRGTILNLEVAIEAALAAAPEQNASDNPMTFFSENVDAWGAAEWFDRLAKAIRAQDTSVVKGDEISTETYKMIASSSAMRLVRDFEHTVRIALSALAAAPEQKPVAWRWQEHFPEWGKDNKGDIASQTFYGEASPPPHKDIRDVTPLYELKCDAHTNESFNDITALKAENERLREAVRRVTATYASMEDGNGDPCPDIAFANSALKAAVRAPQRQIVDDEMEILKRLADARNAAFKEAARIIEDAPLRHSNTEIAAAIRAKVTP